MPNINEVIENLKTAREETIMYGQAKDDARDSAIRAIRKIEKALSDALGAERLRGLDNIAPHGHSPKVFAARLRASSSKPFILEKDKPVLCVNDLGCLSRVRMDAAGFVQSDLATDDDLNAEDLEHFLNVLDRLLPTHIERCREAGERYRRVSAIAEALSLAMAQLPLD